MIDPHNITNYEMTDEHLEEWFLFSVAVAGKTAVVISKAIDRFLMCCRERLNQIYRMQGLVDGAADDLTPLEIIGALVAFDEDITYFLKDARVGKYRTLKAAYAEVAERVFRDKKFLRSATTDQLEEIHGVGPKTARMFVMHSRANQQVAALDTHVLAYLRDCGYNAPKTTPSSKKKYAELEAIFIGMAKKARMAVADFDLKIWRKYTKTKAINGTESTTGRSSGTSQRKNSRAGRAGIRKNEHAH